MGVLFSPSVASKRLAGKNVLCQVGHKALTQVHVTLTVRFVNFSLVHNLPIPQMSCKSTRNFSSILLTEQQ